MLDQAAVNARILKQCKNWTQKNRHKNTAHEAIESIVTHLVTPHLIDRSKIKQLRSDVKTGIIGMLSEEPFEEYNGEFRKEKITLPKRVRCALCTRKEDRKTTQTCICCQLPICEKHSVLVCEKCYGLG